ncbi:MAG: hypothetical protein SFT81_07135 [Candidatus Caenarcaniphilales bacterium]|nr:hypothetical protein [Candidatus Caenarcaniphilales bacterium]
MVVNLPTSIPGSSPSNTVLAQVDPQTQQKQLDQQRSINGAQNAQDGFKKNRIDTKQLFEQYKDLLARSPDGEISNLVTAFLNDLIKYEIVKADFDLSKNTDANGKQIFQFGDISLIPSIGLSAQLRLARIQVNTAWTEYILKSAINPTNRDLNRYAINEVLRPQSDEIFSLEELPKAGEKGYTLTVDYVKNFFEARKDELGSSFTEADAYKELVTYLSSRELRTPIEQQIIVELGLDSTIIKLASFYEQVDRILGIYQQAASTTNDRLLEELKQLVIDVNKAPA